MTTTAIERLPWPVRFLVGSAVGSIAVGLTYAAPVLHSFPLVLAFPTVVLSGWYMNTAGSFGCALVEVVLIDLLMTRAHFHFSTGVIDETVRLWFFLVMSTLLGVLTRRFANQRVELKSRELEERLLVARTQQEVAEERARAAEQVRASDEMLQLALRASGMGLWAWDAATGKVAQSDEVFQIIGRNQGEIGILPENWMAIVHPDDRLDLYWVMKACKESGGSARHTYRILRPDGEVRWVELQGNAQLDSEGRVRRISGVAMDVTQARRREEAMLRAEKLAVAGRLAASVAHEINNPLAAATNLMYLVSMAATLDDAQTHARAALDELMRVSLITQSTLKFHRQSGEPRRALVSEVLESLRTMFRSRLRTASVELDVEIRSESGLVCMAGEVQQVLANLISNAVDAMPQGGRLRIRLRTSLDWRDGRTAGMRMTLLDTGTGMSRATRARLFEPFFTTKAETGTGLGMWVVAQLVQSHGGDVRIKSSTRPGASGTAVTVFLPLEPAKRDSRAALPPTAEAIAAARRE